jgi:hypothetical protein
MKTPSLSIGLVHIASAADLPRRQAMSAKAPAAIA